MKNILCFGDSNTYGYRPDGTGRYDEKVRWTKRLQSALGVENFNVIEEGLSGRTTVFEDELRSDRKGINAISMILETHNPLDLVIIMLGTNDCKVRYGVSAGVIAKGLEQIIHKVKQLTKDHTKILVISPILLGEGVGEKGFDIEFNTNSEIVSRGIALEYEKVALRNQCEFLDASKIANASSIDREHLDEEGHARLARALTDVVPKLI